MVLDPLAGGEALHHRPVKATRAPGVEVFDTAQLSELGAALLAQLRDEWQQLNTALGSLLNDAALENN